MSSENLPSAQHAALSEVAEVEAQLGEQPLAVAATSGVRRSALATFLWALPATLWLSVFLLAPVIMIVLVSFWTRNTNGFDAWNWTTANYRTLLDTDVYQTALLRTFQRAVFVCMLALVIGYPIAYFLSQIKSLRTQIALFILVLAPFWTAYLIRVIAWSPVLGQNGAINYLAGKLGVGPFDFLLYSDFAVNVTLVQLYVLFMVTPIFFQLAAIDHSAIEAAKDLGASPYKVFREVILPLSLPGVMIGFIFIFVLVMGDFATVRFIGGSTVDSVGNEVNVYYNNVDLPTAAAGASILVIAMMIGVVILLRFAKIRDSVSVVASAKPPHRTLDAIGKWLLAAVVAVLGLYTLYASWRTLLELAVGIAVVAGILVGLYYVLGRKLQRVLGVFFAGFLVLMYGPTLLMALLSFQGSRGLTAFPTSGLFSTYWYDILINDETQAALRDSIVVSLKLIDARLHHHRDPLADARHGVPRAVPRLDGALLPRAALAHDAGAAALARHHAADVLPRPRRQHLHDGARRAGRVGAALRLPRHADRLQPLRREGGRGGARPRCERDTHVPGGHAADRLGRGLRRRAVRVHAGLERVRAHVSRHRAGRHAADGALHRDDGDRLPAVHLRARRADDAVLIRADRALPDRQRPRGATRALEGDPRARTPSSRCRRRRPSGD